MRLSTLFTINGVIFAVYGLLALFIPGTLLGFFYETPVGQPGIDGQRYVGALFLGLAVLAWYARKAEESRARQAIVRGFFIAFVIAFIVDLVGQLSGAWTALGWSGVIINGGLALGYGYFWFAKPSSS